APPAAVAAVAREPIEAPAPVAQPAMPVASLSHPPLSGSTDPIAPVRVKTITVKAGNVQTAALYPLVAPAPQATIAPPHLAKHAAPAPVPATVQADAAPLPPPPGARPGVL